MATNPLPKATLATPPQKKTHASGVTVSIVQRAQMSIRKPEHITHTCWGFLHDGMFGMFNDIAGYCTSSHCELKRILWKCTYKLSRGLEGAFQRVGSIFTTVTSWIYLHQARNAIGLHLYTALLPTEQCISFRVCAEREESYNTCRSTRFGLCLVKSQSRRTWATHIFSCFG